MGQPFRCTMAALGRSRTGKEIESCTRLLRPTTISHPGSVAPAMLSPPESLLSGRKHFEGK